MKRSPSNKKPERNREILKLRAQGMTLEKIGARYSISGERVRQIWVRLGKEGNHE